jgi:signal transduction histidine kinase
MARLRGGQRGWRIGTLLVLSIVGVAALSVLALTVVDSVGERALHRRQLEGLAGVLANTAADVLADALYVGDIERLRHQAALLRAQAQVVEFEIFRADGRRLVSSESEKWTTGQVEASILERAYEGSPPRWRQDDDRLDTVRPILVGAEVLGGVRIVLDSSAVGQTIRGVVLRHLWQGVVLIAVATALAVSLARSLTKPVRRLAEATERISAGEYSLETDGVGSGELGELARSLQKMADELREQAERAAEERNRILEQEVELRREAQSKAEHSAQELARTVAKLEAQNAEMERFTYTVSHDLKSPLFTISGFVGVLRQEVEKGRLDEHSRALDRISGAAATMHELLDGLLELSRVGRVVGRSTHVPLAAVAEEAIELLVGEIRIAGCSVSIEKGLPVVLVDRQRMRDVFLNLVGNAIKFMGDQPSPSIRIGMREGERGPVFMVRDNGIGIAPEYREKIFDLFERLDHSVQGTGIGLALAKRVIEQFGGSIWVESDGPGRGCTFCFTLPTSGEVAPAPSDG